MSWLTEELVRLGHDVTLFASGDSVTNARLVPACPRALRLDSDCKDPLARHVVMMEQVFAGMTDRCAAQIAAGAVDLGSWNSVLGTTLVVKWVATGLIRDPAGVVYSHCSPDGNWWPGGASSVGAGILAQRFAGDSDSLSAQAEHR